MLKKITVLKCGYLYKKQPNFRFKLSRYKCIIFIHFALYYFLFVGVAVGADFLNFFRFFTADYNSTVIKFVHMYLQKNQTFM